MRRWDRRDTEVETETVGAPARPPAEAEILALQRSAGNRAVAAQIQRLKIGGERISDDSRVTAAMAELNEIASEQPASRPFLEKREKTRKKLETWVREGKRLPGDAHDPNTFVDWPAAVRAAYVDVGGRPRAAGAPPAAASAAPAAKEKRTKPPEPMVHSHRGQTLDPGAFKEDVLQYLSWWPDVANAEQAARAICDEAKDTVADIGSLNTRLASNEKGTPHKSQHTKAVNKLKFIMVKGKLAALPPEHEGVAELTNQKDRFLTKATEKGATHHMTS